MTTFRPAPTCATPRCADSSSAPKRDASHPCETVRLRNPGPATSTFSNASQPLSSPAIFMPASRGLRRIAFASRNASLHW